MINGKINRIKRILTKKTGSLYIVKELDTDNKISLSEEVRIKNILLLGSESKTIDFYKKTILKFIKNNEPFILINDMFYCQNFNNKINDYIKKYNYSYDVVFDNYNIQELDQINFFDKNKTYIFNLLDSKNKLSEESTNKTFKTFFQEYFSLKLHSDFETIYNNSISNELLSNKLFNIIFTNLPININKSSMYANSHLLNSSFISYYKDYISYVNNDFYQYPINYSKTKIYFYTENNEKFDDLKHILFYKKPFANYEIEKNCNYIILDKNLLINNNEVTETQIIKVK